MGLEQRGCIVQPYANGTTSNGRTLLDKAKPFSISKVLVWETYKRVKANGGAAGVDCQSIEEFEVNLKDNLYKLWNRMASGSYSPPPVRRVEIPKSEGGKRPLGIPTVSDRIAQMVVKLVLEPEVEPHFHTDSYGYRPGRSATEAVGVARRRCWHYDWVVDMDIRAFFDSMDHELLMRAVRKHTQCQWMLLYIERWLKAPVQLENGTCLPRDKGTPQGGVISLLLANLFLHYAFDRWMQCSHPNKPFERLRRRCDRALQIGICGQASAQRDRPANGRVRASPAPGQDEGGLLQRRATAQKLLRNAFRLSGVSIPAPVRTVPWGRIVPQLSPCCQRESRKVDSANDP